MFLAFFLVPLADCELTDDDLDIVAGKRDQLLGRIQERHGIDLDAAETQLQDWEK